MLQPLSFTQGDRRIEVDAGGNILTPASPQLPAATGGRKNQPKTYSVGSLPNWLEYDDDPAIRRVKIKDEQTAPTDLFRPMADSFTYTVSDGTTEETIPIIVWVQPTNLVTDEDLKALETEEQEAYQWSDDYITPPAVVNTQGEQTNDAATPAGWQRAKGNAPDGKPFLWRIDRNRIKGNPWTPWGDPVPDVGTIISEQAAKEYDELTVYKAAPTPPGPPPDSAGVPPGWAFPIAPAATETMPSLEALASA